MLTALLVAGYIAGILTCLLLLKLLPVKLSFSWSEQSFVSKTKAWMRKKHPNYCPTCDAIPCEDPWQHQYDSD